MKTILILAYYSVEDPVFKSAVLPYFLNFPDRDIKFIMCTYENDRYPLTPEKRKFIKSVLKENNIQWIEFKWRSGRFKLLKKILDLLKSIWSTRQIIKVNHVTAVYSEGFPGAIIGYFICRLNQVKHYIHTFEPHADYMLEARVWKNFSWEYIFLKKLESIIARQASLIFTATEGMRQRIQTWGVNRDKIYLVPSAINLSSFYYDENARLRIRSELHVTEKECLIVYLGKLGGMYMEEEIFDFYKYLSLNSKLKYKFLFLTAEPLNKILSLADEYGLSKGDVMAFFVPSEEVYQYLSAADFGFVAVRQRSSKKYCSPIKTGEYLACGLPVIVPRGISDDYLNIVKHDVGVILDYLDVKSFVHTTAKIEDLFLNSNHPELINRTRSYAKKYRDIAQFKKLYASVF